MHLFLTGILMSEGEQVDVSRSSLQLTCLLFADLSETAEPGRWR